LLQFRKQFYEQLDGVAKGLLQSPVLSYIYKNQLKNWILQKSKFSDKCQIGEEPDEIPYLLETNS
jgi:hypothetical protein